MKISQKTMMHHSEVKVELLKKYLERYLNILTASQYIDDIYLFDLFCGEGIYENGGKGSPIVILEEIKIIYFQQKARGKEIKKFNCHFNDIDNSKIEKLKNEVNTRNLHYPYIGDLNYSEIDYNILVKNVANKIDALNKEKAFVFIDPYGYKDISISDIKNLLKSEKSEVLLFLPTQFMFRFEEKGTPESLMKFIDELIPIDLWPYSDTGLDFINQLTEAFRGAVGEKYLVDSFVISREKNQFFCLFFFTSHIFGFNKMLESKWKIDEEEGRGWVYQQNNDLFSQVEKKPNIFKFEKKLLEYLKKDRTNSELYSYTLSCGHLPSHTTEILKKIQIEGRLQVKKQDGTDARKSSFYISYDKYKKEPEKVKIKIIGNGN
jgi:three-Cys-motif partner protein